MYLLLKKGQTRKCKHNVFKTNSMTSIWGFRIQHGSSRKQTLNFYSVNRNSIWTITKTQAENENFK